MRDEILRGISLLMVLSGLGLFLLNATILYPKFLKDIDSYKEIPEKLTEIHSIQNKNTANPHPIIHGTLLHILQLKHNLVQESQLTLLREFSLLLVISGALLYLYHRLTLIERYLKEKNTNGGGEDAKEKL